MTWQVRMRMNAVNAKNGMVMNPSQLIYSPVQGTTPHEMERSPRNDIFWIE